MGRIESDNDNHNENRVCLTRSASNSRKKQKKNKKRASAAAPHPLQLSNSKKRVPLGELTNSLDLAADHSAPTSPAPEETARNPPEDPFKESDSPIMANQSTQNESPSGPTRNSDFVVVETTQEPECNAKKRKREDAEASPCTELTQAQNMELERRSYSSSIYQYLRSLEIADNQRPLPNYMEEVQNDISATMRELLVDWLVDVADEYKLVSDTLYLTVSYIDRFLSSKAVNRNKLQLLGVTCMLIASKYEEISPPHVEDFCYMTDNTYTNKEVVDMERDVLGLLNFEMSTPTTKSFLRILTRTAHINDESTDLQFEFLSCYFAELSLLDYGCLRFLPSVIAASAIFISRFTLQPKMHPWSTELRCCSGYRPSDLKECVLAIHNLLFRRKGSALQAVRDKYAQHKFKCVATLSPPSEIPLHYFEAIEE